MRGYGLVESLEGRSSICEFKEINDSLGVCFFLG